MYKEKKKKGVVGIIITVVILILLVVISNVKIENWSEVFSPVTSVVGGIQNRNSES